MKTNVRKVLPILFLVIIIIGFTPELAFAETSEKSILIITDELDFSMIENINTEYKLSLGLMNTRSSNFFHKSQEGYFMTLATSRRIKLENGLFQGVMETSDGQLIIEGYENILQGLDDDYRNFSEEMDFLGEVFSKEAIDVGYIGNDESALLAANKEGVIPRGTTKVTYDIQWLDTQTQDILKDTEVLILSYDIDNESDRIELLEEYINKYPQYNMMIFPREITGDVKDIRNSTLVPFLYHSPQEGAGILTSLSTKREGFITNLDILPHLASIYDIPLKTSVGQGIYVEDEHLSQDEIIDSNRMNLKENLNGIIIKYIFHGLIIFIQLYIFYGLFWRKKRDIEKYHDIIQSIFMAIFLSLLLGFFRLKQSIILYCSLIIILTVFILIIKQQKSINGFVFPIGTNILLLWSIYFNPNIIYNSFFGFNNIVSGGRFYGFNNETMGILLATAIITFFAIKRKINNRYLSTITLILYFSIVINALTGNYGSNFGGFLASIGVFFMLVYTVFPKDVTHRKNIIMVVIIGLSIFLISFFIDTGGHAGSFFARVESLGIYEFIDMIGKKLRQLVLTAIAPPWSIVFISQLYFIKRMAQENSKWIQRLKQDSPHVVHEMFIIFMSSLLVFVLNDTGVTAFVYMITYLIGTIFFQLLTNNRHLV